MINIEGLARNGKMHPVQEAFKKHHGLQCGFCTPGMIMSAVDLLQKNKNPSEQMLLLVYPPLYKHQQGPYLYKRL